MKPVTSQDTKWTRLQITQGPKHQHIKLRGLGCLPTRSTQPERYSRSPGQHDLSVQIRRLKRPLWQKFDYQSCAPRRYLRFGHVEGPIRISELGDMAPKISATQSVWIRTNYIPRPIWSSYLRFQGKKWIPKLNIILRHTTCTPNLHYLESGRGRYGAGKEGLRIRKIWMRLILWKPSLLLSEEDLVQGKVEHAPMHPKDINTIP
jgi:hypothetical protein